MKLTCPKCQAKSQIADQLVPVNGAWASCPRCSERFFIKPLGQGLDLNQAAAPAQPAPRAPRSQEAQKIIDRYRANQGMDQGGQDDFDPAYITVFPEQAASSTPYFALLILGAVVAVVAMVVTFNSAGERAVITQPEPRPVQVARPYGQEELKGDLIFLRNRFRRLANVNLIVESSGTESRLYNYLLKELAPYECKEIRRIHFRSAKPAQGFTAEAACLEIGRNSPFMHVQWNQNKAFIRFEGNNKRMEVELYPPAALTPAEEP